MDKESIEKIINPLMDHYVESYDSPSKNDWECFRKKFGTDFGESFVNFIELMSQYEFPGDVLNVSTGKINLNGSIFKSFDSDIAQDYWSPSMVSFYSIGNGDEFCLNKDEGETSKVYYFSHSNNSYEAEFESFDEWVLGLEEELSA